jgi:ATP-dependent Clp protease ATP-binding subunit ClpC
MTGASYGTYFERVEKLLREAAEKKIILFIDEAHHFLNVGYSRTDNLGNLLKPVLARGDFACILATTHDEYRQFIQKDKALDRRFQTVYVAEPSAEETLSILRSFAEAMGWTVAEDLLRQIVIWAGQWIRHRYFPDKALDVLDQSMAVALTRQRELDRSIIQEVICRMLQVPLDWSDRLARLEEYLQPRVFLDPAGLRSLAERLRFTVPGYDVRKHRPNAVVLVLGPEGFGDGALGRELSQALYGTPDRVIDIDLSRFTEDHDITGLLGAQPSYVGYGDRVPLHDLLFQPWSVVVFKNVDQCHPTIRETIAAALEAGYFTDGMNNRLFVGDTVCIFTLVEDLEFSKPIGFTSSPQAKAVPAENWAQRLGSLAEAVDITLRAGLPNEEALRRWLETALLGDLQKRLASQGIQVLWEPALVDWLLSQRQTCQSPRDWERLLEERLWPHVGPVLARMASQGLILRLQVHQGPAKSGQGEEEVSLKVEAEEKVEEGPNPESPSGEEEKALPT